MEEEPNTRLNPTAPLRSGGEPGAHGGTPPCHATHVACACRLPRVPIRSWRGGLRVPHLCPVGVPAVCLHAHVPRCRVTSSNVNAKAGFLWLQVHESLSSGGGNLLPRADHLRAAAGPARAGAAPTPPPRRGYLGRPRGEAAAASSCAAAGGTQEPAAVAGPNPLASPRARRAPWLAPHGAAFSPAQSLPATFAAEEVSAKIFDLSARSFGLLPALISGPATPRWGAHRGRSPQSCRESRGTEQKERHPAGIRRGSMGGTQTWDQRGRASAGPEPREELCLAGAPPRHWHGPCTGLPLPPCRTGLMQPALPVAQAPGSRHRTVPLPGTGARGDA